VVLRNRNLGVLESRNRNYARSGFNSNLTRLQLLSTLLGAEDYVTITRLKKHASLFAIAVGVIATAYAIAVVANATGFAFPSEPFSGTIFVGVLATSLSLPLVVVIVLFIARPRMRQTWRQAGNLNRGGLVAYLALEVAAAVAAWVAFFYVATHG
jgi:hypothetical protein